MYLKHDFTAVGYTDKARSLQPSAQLSADGARLSRERLLLSLGRPIFELYAGAYSKDALCVLLIGLRVSYNQNDETLSRNSLMYITKANLPTAVHW